jgi:hypothetical protein
MKVERTLPYGYNKNEIKETKQKDYTRYVQVVQWARFVILAPNSSAPVRGSLIYKPITWLGLWPALTAASY